MSPETLSLIPAMAILSAWSGGSLWPSQYIPHKITWLPEAVLGLGVAYATFPIYGPWCVLAGLWSYLFFQSATAPALHWGRGHYNPERTSKLKPFVDWIAKKLNYDPSTVQYCRLYMGIRGFLIGLPLGGIPIAVLFPLSYEPEKQVYRELLSGASLGFICYLWLAHS